MREDTGIEIMEKNNGKIKTCYKAFNYSSLILYMTNEISISEAYLAFKPFINRNDCFAVMKDDVNEYTVIKEFLFPKYFKDHIDGKITLGLFQISKDRDKIKWLCWDFDAESESEESLRIVFEDAKKLYEYLVNEGYAPLLEFSGRRDCHVWLFFDALMSKAFDGELV